MNTRFPEYRCRETGVLQDGAVEKEILTTGRKRDAPPARESVGKKIFLAVIMTGKWMRSLDDPAQGVREVIEEPFIISGFEICKDFANVSSAHF